MKDKNTRLIQETSQCLTSPTSASKTEIVSSRLSFTSRSMTMSIEPRPGKEHDLLTVGSTNVKYQQDTYRSASKQSQSLWRAVFQGPW